MTWKFGAGRSGVTTATGTPHIVLETAASEYAEVMEFNIGGEATTSTAQRTGCHRAAEGVGAATAITARAFDEGSSAAATAATQGDHATTPAAPDSPALVEYGWNAHGGVIRWLAAPGEEIIMLGVSTVILENSLGTGQGSYGFVWGEH